MKRLFIFALALATVLTLSAPAFADMMWEPRDDSFFEKNYKKFDYVNRACYANGKDGFVTLWDAPEGSMVRAQYENGELLVVGYTYQDWALMYRYEDGKEISGWMPRADLTLVYDSIAFAEEYENRIVPYNGEFANYDGDIEVVNFYEYPGAPEIEVSPRAGHVLENLTGSQDGVSYIHSIFVDENGLTWGYVGYLYGIRNVWFCLDEPDGESFPVRQIPDPGLTAAQAPTLPAAGYTPYILVAAVVAATVGLLAVFYGKKRRKTTG